MVLEYMALGSLYDLLRPRGVLGGGSLDAWYAKWRSVACTVVDDFVVVGATGTRRTGAFSTMQLDFSSGRTSSGSGPLSLPLLQHDDTGGDVELALMSHGRQEGSRRAEQSKDGNDDTPATVWGLKLRLAKDVACGMSFIHSLGKVHRDIKSGNVLISNTLRAKIADFGTLGQESKRQPRSSTSTDSGTTTTAAAAAAAAPKGTVEYMAPECLRGEEQGPKADVFSFGVLFWEILHEKDPDLLTQEEQNVHVTQIQATYARLLCDEGKRLLFSEGIPRDVRLMGEKCMLKNAKERPSFADLIQELQEVEEVAGEC